MATRATYTVKGMTCDHCVASVTEELSEVDGVKGVQVDLPTGEVAVTSDHELDHDVVAEAVKEAGYELV